MTVKATIAECIVTVVSNPRRAPNALLKGEKKQKKSQKKLSLEISQLRVKYRLEKLHK